MINVTKDKLERISVVPAAQSCLSHFLFAAPSPRKDAGSHDRASLLFYGTWVHFVHLMCELLKGAHVTPLTHYIDMKVQLGTSVKRTSLEHSPSPSFPGLPLLSVMTPWPGSLQNWPISAAHHDAAAPTNCEPQQGWRGRIRGTKSHFNHILLSRVFFSGWRTGIMNWTQTQTSATHMTPGFSCFMWSFAFKNLFNTTGAMKTSELCQDLLVGLKINREVEESLGSTLLSQFNYAADVC